MGISRVGERLIEVLNGTSKTWSFARDVGSVKGDRLAGVVMLEARLTIAAGRAGYFLRTQDPQVSGQCSLSVYASRPPRLTQVKIRIAVYTYQYRTDTTSASGQSINQLSDPPLCLNAHRLF